MLIVGALGAVALSILFRDRALRSLRVANLTIGMVGGPLASLDSFRQTEDNPYCTVGGIWPTVGSASILLIAVAFANSRAFHRAVGGWFPRNPT